MNRLLLIPFLASCAGFALLTIPGLGWMPAVSESTTPISESIAARTCHLLDRDEAGQDLTDKWQEYDSQRRMMSRVHRPKSRFRPEIFLDTTELVSEPGFAGVFKLHGESRTIDFPIVIGRISGDTLIWSGSAWMAFDLWLGQGGSPH